MWQNVGTLASGACTGDLTVDWTLELIIVPVSDIDRAKSFYVDRAGFVEIVDIVVGEDMRVVQLTPPGSGCAIALMSTTPMAPGSIYGLHVVVPDIEAARAELVGRGVDVSDYFHFGPGGQEPGLAPDRSNYNSFASFADPDGNTWLVQEVDRAKPQAAHDSASG
jgi:catechol 2,3-dioxygenase-like lactoylglutathione lyase family enzyme